MKSGELHHVPPGGATLGREGAKADIQIRDQGVSKRHARIYEKGGAWYLVDMGSSNGTFMHGERLNGPAVLDTGAVFGMSRHKFEVVGLVAEVPSTAPDPDATLNGTLEALPDPQAAPSPSPPPPPSPPHSGPVPRPPARAASPDPSPELEPFLQDQVTGQPERAPADDFSGAPSVATAMSPAMEAPVASPQPPRPAPPQPAGRPTPRGLWVAVGGAALGGVVLMAALAFVLFGGSDDPTPVTPLPDTRTNSGSPTKAPEPSDQGWEARLMALATASVEGDPKVTFPEFIKHRDKVEQLIANDPTLLNRDEDLLKAYGQYHRDRSRAEAKFAVATDRDPALKAVHERLRDAELYRLSSTTIENLYRKLTAK